LLGNWVEETIDAVAPSFNLASRTCLAYPPEAD
jgi:hypothetical protein